MQPKKKVIDRAIENGSIQRVNMLLFATHLSRCEIEISNIIGKTPDILTDLMPREIEKLFNDLDKNQDRYSNEFAKMVDTLGRCKNLISDCDEFGKKFREWAKIK